MDYGQIPIGVKDLLPEEAARERLIEARIRSLFRSWGYKEIITPTFEFFDVLALGTGLEMHVKMYKFLDQRGRVLALRSEMTTPIARVVANKLKNTPLPLRLCYLANVFRYYEPQAGRQREFYQAGIELLGADSLEADVEVIALAVESLKRAGLTGFKVSIGHTCFLRGILKEIDLSREEGHKLKRTLYTKDFVHLAQILAELSVDKNKKELILKLPTLCGKEEIVEKAIALTNSQEAQKSLEAVLEVFQKLKIYGIEDCIDIDLGIIRNFDYYTGIVLEGYIGGLGFPLCGGGRYDNLLEQFGYKCPATGFAISIDRVLLALENRDSSYPVQSIDLLVVFTEDTREEAFQMAQKLREGGLIVEIDIMKHGIETSLAYAKARKIDKVIKMTNKTQALVKDLRLEKEATVTPGEILDMMLNNNSEVKSQ